MIKKNIIILAGCLSLEHEISIITALQVLENIDKVVYNPLFVYITRDLQFELVEGLTHKQDFFQAKRTPLMFGNDGLPFFATSKIFGLSKTYIEAAILTTHGGLGEGGQLQGMLDIFKIPYFSAKAEAAAVCLNKSITKSILKDKIPLVPFFTYHLDQSLARLSYQEVATLLGKKIILKPSKLGSSIGITIINSELEFEKAIMNIGQYEKSILMESFLENIVEYNCAVKKVNSKIFFSEIEQPIKSEDILSFDDKYQKGSKKGENSIENNLFNSQCPANITLELKNQIRDYSSKVYNYLGCEGVARVDFIFHNNQIYFSEINTIPGSLSKKLFEASGVSFCDQISEMITQASVVNLDNYKWFDKSDLIKKYIQ